jgi:hypothetical protein
MSRNILFVLMYYRHDLLDLINRFGSKYVNVPVNNIRNWSASNRRTFFSERAESNNDDDDDKKNALTNFELSYAYEFKYISLFILVTTSTTNIFSAHILHKFRKGYVWSFQA